MTEIAAFIEINLAEKLQNREYRQAFFLAESSADIAKQLVDLRKRRGLDQAQLAALVGTQQPAISRIEKADYQNWSFNTLRKIAAAEDARIRIEIKPSEDVLSEYEMQSEVMPTENYNYDALMGTAQVAALAGHAIPVSKIHSVENLAFTARGNSGVEVYFLMANAGRYLAGVHAQLKSFPRRYADAKDVKIEKLEDEIARLKQELADAKADQPHHPINPRTAAWQQPGVLQMSAPIGIPTP